MRILRTVLLAMLVLAAVSATARAQSKANIVGSPHDLTTDTWSATSSGTASAVTTNLCFFCHITHKTATNITTGNAASATPGYLLWNHTLSSTTSYGVYSSETFNAALAAAGQNPPTDLGTNNNITSPTVSNLCLSCHDGTVAIGSFYEGGFGLPANGSYWNNGHGNSSTMWTGMQISDLTKQHPVHFQYTAALASVANMTSPASANSVDGSGKVPLYGGAYYMECSTCHDPHNGTTAVRGSLFPFARSALAGYSGTGSFCNYCHT
jgi:hypothetical protein